MAILLGEDEAAAFRGRIEAAGGAMLSAATAVGIAAVSSRDDALFDAAQAFLDEPFIAIEAVDAGQAAAAGNACRSYGKGRHPAGLNLGDVFAYALARERNLPLLFKGEDFARTDIEPA